MTKYTLGPWQFAHRECADGMYRTQVFNSQDVIANVNWYPVASETGTIETARAANARLIAAAPDLLASLLEMHAMLHGWMEDNTGPRELDALERCEQAIVKAGGDL